MSHGPEAPGAHHQVAHDIIIDMSSRVSQREAHEEGSFLRQPRQRPPMFRIHVLLDLVLHLVLNCPMVQTEQLIKRGSVE